MFQVHKKLASHFSKKHCIFVRKRRELRSDKKPRRNWVLKTLRSWVLISELRESIILIKKMCTQYIKHVLTVIVSYTMILLTCYVLCEYVIVIHANLQDFVELKGKNKRTERSNYCLYNFAMIGLFSKMILYCHDLLYFYHLNLSYISLWRKLGASSIN